MKKGTYEVTRSRGCGRVCVFGLVLLLCIGLVSVFLYKKPTHTDPVAAASSPSLCAQEPSSCAEAVEQAVPGESLPLPFWSENLPQSATYTGSAGAYLICIDPVEMNQGSHYAAYSVEGGQLIPWENHSFSAELSVLGQAVHGEFDYGVKDEQVLITHIPAEGSGNEIRFFHDTSQGIHSVLIGVNLTLPDGRFLHYPVYLDLETGAVTDFLKDMNRETVYEVFSSEIYPMISMGEEAFLFARQDANSSFSYFYLDVASQEITDLEVLSGKDMENAVPLSDEIICWDSNGDFWSLSLESWKVTPLIHAPNVVFRNGVFHHSRGYGSSFFLYRDDGKRLCLYDFVTREATVLEEPDGWQFDKGAHMPCGFGRMLCMPWQGKEDTYLLLDADTCALHLLEVPHPGTPYLHMWEKAAPDELVFMSDNHMDYYFYKVK